MTAIEPVHAETIVELSKEKAFSLFTQRFSDWWPRDYSYARDVLDKIVIEPRVSGRCTEYGPNEFQVDWGTVKIWEPPSRLVILWQLSPHSTPEPNPKKASILEVAFVSEGDSRTRVSVEHTAFEKHGEGAEKYRQEMASEYGWPFILAQYAAAIT